MAKFMNKKEQVFDLKLTSYGHYLMAIGKFKPAYYAFYDDNVLYDGQYVGVLEGQNEIQDRIKNKTQYLESLVLFQDLEELTIPGQGILDFFSDNKTGLQTEPRKDIYKFDTAIGDAYLDGDTQRAPAWKLVALQSTISSSAPKDDANETSVPQINIDAAYTLKTADTEYNFNPADARNLNGQTSAFIDNKSIYLIADDPLCYIEEVNTEILTENFDIEVFEVLTGSNVFGNVTTQLERKYFKREIPQIQNGFLVSERPLESALVDLDTQSVEFYFDILFDEDIDKAQACLGVDQFNKGSYYIDLDFDCDESDPEDMFFDIYGSSTEPEICR